MAFAKKVTCKVPPFEVTEGDGSYFVEKMRGVIKDKYHFQPETLVYNASPTTLYAMALRREQGSSITSTGALSVRSGKYTGRTPKDKRVVEEACSVDDVWWGPINKKLPVTSFDLNRYRAFAFLSAQDCLYVFDGYAGWDQRYAQKIRIICTRAYHALFMRNMLIRPTMAQLADFGEPDFTVFNAGVFPCDPAVPKCTTLGDASVALSFERKEIVVLGSQYAGEMKKGVFTVMHYLMPKRGVLSMHCSANEGDDPSDVSIFFGLSGTGKTTLSADGSRKLIGDDEHCWSDDGVFNIEGGCYAKAIDLDWQKEPEIYNAIKFGSVQENCVVDPDTGVVDYTDSSIAVNTRISYPIEYIPSSKIPCVGGHPNNVILLTCDAFGVLPPVAKLTPEQAMYHFISGYTAKVAGTEIGVKEPKAAFSSCFGAPFLVWHPAVYAKLLAQKLKKHRATAWLVNTGWSGGAYGVGKRMSIKISRAVIRAIQTGELLKAKYTTTDVFGLHIPTSCTDVHPDVLNPINTWEDKAAFNKKLNFLGHLFLKNFKNYEAGCEKDVLKAGPKPVMPPAAKL
jgi:phosphoenolpyruvate carboxykinase (ATP)